MTSRPSGSGRIAKGDTHENLADRLRQGKKDSILLVDFANRRRAEGESVTDAICDAGRVRLRPILMTSLAAVLALTPMAIGGTGAEANVPLARAIIGGALGAALLSLVPSLYVVLKQEPRSMPPRQSRSAPTGA